MYHAAAKRLPASRQSAILSPVDREISDFLSGRTHGERLLHAIYDRVLDEPVPERLRAALHD